MLPDVSQEVVYDQATIDELLRRPKDDKTLLHRLFEIYLEETPRLLGEIEEGMESKDAEVVYDALHQMKGSASALGARRVFRLAEASLPICRDGKVLEIDDLVERIEEESDTFIGEVSAILSRS